MKITRVTDSTGKRTGVARKNQHEAQLWLLFICLFFLNEILYLIRLQPLWSVLQLIFLPENWNRHTLDETDFSIYSEAQNWYSTDWRFSSDQGMREVCVPEQLKQSSALAWSQPYLSLPSAFLDSRKSLSFEVSLVNGHYYPANPRTVTPQIWI